MLKSPKTRSPKHLRFIASLPCAICGAEDVQAAHIRSGNGGGMGYKPGDKFTVPLCVKHHSKQHCVGEKSFWAPHGGIEKATALAKELHKHTGHHAKGQRIIHNWRNENGR